jgi:hypothetical protein
MEHIKFVILLEYYLIVISLDKYYNVLYDFGIFYLLNKTEEKNEQIYQNNRDLKRDKN